MTARSALRDGLADSVDDTVEKHPWLERLTQIGWIGRGIVTVLVGFFIVRAAVRFDPDDARGFDRSLRQVVGTGTGSALVLVCAVGLIAYGIFCLMSHRFRTLKGSGGLS